MQRGEALGVGRARAACRRSRAWPRRAPPARKSPRRSAMSIDVVADVAAEQQEDRGLLALGEAGGARRRSASSNQATALRRQRRPVTGTRAAHGCGACARENAHAQRARPARQPSAGARRAASPAPRRPSARAARPSPRRSDTATSPKSRAHSATRLIDTACEAFGGGDATAASTIASRRGRASGPWRAAARTPQRAAMLGGRPVARIVVDSAYTLRNSAYAIRRKTIRRSA